MTRQEKAAATASFADAALLPLYSYIRANPGKSQRTKAWLAQYLDSIGDKRQITIAMHNMMLRKLQVHIQAEGGIKIAQEKSGSYTVTTMTSADSVRGGATKRRAWVTEFVPYTPPKTVRRETGLYALDRTAYSNDYLRSF